MYILLQETSQGENASAAYFWKQTKPSIQTYQKSLPNTSICFTSLSLGPSNIPGIHQLHRCYRLQLASSLRKSSSRPEETACDNTGPLHHFAAIDCWVRTLLKKIAWKLTVIKCFYFPTGLPPPPFSLCIHRHALQIQRSVIYWKEKVTDRPKLKISHWRW